LPGSSIALQHGGAKLWCNGCPFSFYIVEMVDISVQWLRSFVPLPNTVPRTERMRAVAGALLGLLLTAGLSELLTGAASVPAALVAPMGASAVLLFCVPGST
jgi:CBS domain-containing membrane protein